jgi:hypothetical protein
LSPFFYSRSLNDSKPKCLQFNAKTVRAHSLRPVFQKIQSGIMRNAKNPI